MANLKQTLFCQSITADVLNKDMLRNLSRTGYASLALSKKQGTILKLFLVRNRVRLLGSQRHPTLKFWGYLGKTGYGDVAVFPFMPFRTTVKCRFHDEDEDVFAETLLIPILILTQFLTLIQEDEDVVTEMQPLLILI